MAATKVMKRTTFASALNEWRAQGPDAYVQPSNRRTRQWTTVAGFGGGPMVTAPTKIIISTSTDRLLYLTASEKVRVDSKELETDLLISAR